MRWKIYESRNYIVFIGDTYNFPVHCIYNTSELAEKVAYALSPVDFIPDFIPVLGYLDDVILLPMLVALTVKFIPNDVLEKNRRQAEGTWQEGKPKKWYYAIPIIIIWILIIALIIKAII